MISVEAAFRDLATTQSGRDLAFACYYEMDVINACRRFEASEEWHAVLAILSSFAGTRRSALDLGAGNGIGSYALARQGYRVAAVEPDPSDLVGYGALRSMAKSSELPIDHHDAFGERLPFADDSFDLVYARQVLHHASNLGQMITEIARVLRPGGLFLACREHVIDDATSLSVFLANHPIHQLAQNENAFTLNHYVMAMGTKLKMKKVFGPWDSAINHYPVSNSEFRDQMRAKFRARYGNAGLALCRLRAVERIYRSRMSACCVEPGRMYTFVATA